MKFKYLILMLFALVLMLSPVGCDIGNSDYADDFQEVKQIIEKDLEGAFGSEIIIEQNATTPLKTLAKIERIFRYRFGRIINSSTRTINRDEITIVDSTAQGSFTITYSGQFKVIDDSLKFDIVKELVHPMKRYVTFVRRFNPVLNQKWTTTSISAAFGATLNSKLRLDSLRIRTRRETIDVTDPFDITFSPQRPIILKGGDTLFIEAKVVNTDNIFDAPVGFVTTGRNNFAGRIKSEMVRLGGGRFSKVLRVDSTSTDAINQLVIDFITQSSVNTNIGKPYDSFIISIPYRRPKEK